MLVKQRIQTNIFYLVMATVVAGLLVVIYGSQAQAQTASSNALKISPVRSDIEIPAGTSKTVKMTVTNLTQSPITLKPVSNDFIAGDERGTPALILDADKFAPTHSLKRFMAPISDVTVPAGKFKDVNVVIIVPKDAQPGGYFGAVRFSPSGSASGGQVNLDASAASLILMTVPGPAVEKMRLTDFAIQQGGKTNSYFQSSNDLQATVRFQNQGSVQMGPIGKVTVKQGDNVVYETDFNANSPRDMVLPDSARRWDIPLKNIGSFGHYEVNATFSYGKKNQTIEVKKSFWVVPQMVIIVVIVSTLLLIALIVGIWLGLRAYKRRILRHHSGGSRHRR